MIKVLKFILFANLALTKKIFSFDKDLNLEDPLPIGMTKNHFVSEIQNHTLEDDFAEVQIITNTSSIFFGTIVSLKLKFDEG